DAMFIDRKVFKAGHRSGSIVNGGASAKQNCCKQRSNQSFHHHPHHTASFGASVAERFLRGWKPYFLRDGCTFIGRRRALQYSKYRTPGVSQVLTLTKAEVVRLPELPCKVD